ncbi:CoA transferase [Paraburkholderia aromaticivorans]|uniref:CoA transferase n=1 Tax=Paraburkholderia aromaticivorans TaxID=2026199 RepID=UPI00145613C3|nr:CoA transferase [Paraburkholderia aromaticivorans]
MYQLLHGMRVVECASFIAAPSCALHLQQMGAEVIRIDPIGGGPDYRRWPVSEGGSSFYWEGLNKGKKSIAIDLSSAQGRELATQIITSPGQDSGLFVTNFPQGGFLAHDVLRKRRADLISARVMGWNDGESAVDYTVNAAVGVPLMTGEPVNGDKPVNHVLPAWDLMTGAYAAFALLAAERHRRDTGEGQEVLLPLSDVALTSLGHMGQIAEVLTQGDRPRMGNALFGAFGRDFMTVDGHRIMVVAITARQWSGLVKVLELKSAVAQLESALQVSFARDEGTRFRHREVLFPLFERAIALRSVDDLKVGFSANGVCWSPYRTLQSALTDEPRFSTTGPLFQTLDHPSGHRYPAPGSAATFQGMQRQPIVRAPHLGEHTDQVLMEVLSLSSSQVGELHDAGVVAGVSE